MGSFYLKDLIKNFFFENIKLFINVILFIIISILVGWITIILITKESFKYEHIIISITLIGFSYSLLLINKIYFGIYP